MNRTSVLNLLANVPAGHENAEMLVHLPDGRIVPLAFGLAHARDRVDAPITVLELYVPPAEVPPTVELETPAIEEPTAAPSQPTAEEIPAAPIEPTPSANPEPPQNTDAPVQSAADPIPPASVEAPQAETTAAETSVETSSATAP